MSQFTRVIARPSAGAFTSTATVHRPVRRSAVTSRSPAVLGTRSAAVSTPCSTRSARSAADGLQVRSAARRDRATCTPDPRSRSSRSAAKRINWSHRATTSAAPLSFCRRVPRRTASRTGFGPRQMVERDRALTIDNSDSIAYVVEATRSASPGPRHTVGWSESWSSGPDNDLSTTGPSPVRLIRGKLVCPFDRCHVTSRFRWRRFRSGNGRVGSSLERTR